MSLRIGNGYDIHPLVPERPLILEGVQIPHTLGLLGNTDADVLIHALIDAMLGALCLGDIGHHFPPNDPKVKGLRSVSMLAEVKQMISEKNWKVNNIDTIVVAEKPKLMPYIDSMRDNIARVLEIERDCVSVKAKTNEKLGPVGKEEAIAAHAVVLLSKMV